jgi:DNA topoisomerase I
MQLILVESPTKARTFSKIVPKGITVEATIGHIRDLPLKKFGVDLEKDFAPQYEILPKQKETVERIKKLAAKASTIILATDPDREGEAISYHVAYILDAITEKWPHSKLKKTTKTIQRITFHEITKEALEHALQHPGKINLDLVNAQQARRILDRLVGYKLSPLLWNKMGKRWLSAGRVQTVALRFIVEREKEILRFKQEAFYKLKGQFKAKTIPFEAKLVGKGTEDFYISQRITLFDGTYSFSKTSIDATRAKKIEEDLKKTSFAITELKQTETTKNPPSPYTTSTLQQEAARLLGYSAKMTMSIAQKLYEKGHITYHRTDSVNLSEQFVAKAQTYVKETYGDEYRNSSTRVFKTKNKLAQEAHEAIRPTRLHPDIKETATLSSRHVKLYQLIFKKAVATTMSSAKGLSFTLEVTSKEGYRFESKVEIITFPGYLTLYGVSNQETHYAKLEKGQEVTLKELFSEEDMTKPPPRYGEASLIKTLEERGIGRPSTYAPTISTVQARNYVEKLEGKFQPTMLGTAVCDYLSEAFPAVFGIDFTAKMEDDLDAIAEGKEDMVKLLKTFYKPVEKKLESEFKEKKYIDIEEKSDEKCDLCGAPMSIRYSRFGKFYACTRYPDCTGKKQFHEKIQIPCPKCGSDIYVRLTKKKRRFYGCSKYPTCTYAAWNVQQIAKDAKVPMPETDEKPEGEKEE